MDLPQFLENISQYLSKLVFWWIALTDALPQENFVLYTYGGIAICALILLLLFFWMLPRTLFFSHLRGVIWIIAAAVILTPTSALGDSGEIAPAFIAVAYALLTDNPAAAINALLPILLMIIAGLFIGAIWHFLRYIIENTLIKHQNNSTQIQS